MHCASKSAAQAAARGVTRRNPRKLSVSVFHCRDCGAYHFGHDYSSRVIRKGLKR